MIVNMSNFKKERIFELDQDSKFEKMLTCFDYCVDSFRHKILSATERECLLPCLENQVAVHIEAVNQIKLFESKNGELAKREIKIPERNI